MTRMCMVWSICTGHQETEAREASVLRGMGDQSTGVTPFCGIITVEGREVFGVLSIVNEMSICTVMHCFLLISFMRCCWSCQDLILLNVLISTPSLELDPIPSDL